MKRNIITIVVLLCTSVLVFADYSGSVVTNETELSFSQKDGYDVIRLEKSNFTEEIGAPKLPVKILEYVIPVDMNVKDIIISSSEQVQIDGTYFVYPAQPPYRTDGSDPPPFVEPDIEIYDSSTPYPDKLVEVIADGFTRGYHIVTLRFYPVEYIPVEQKINLYTNIYFTIEYESNPQPIQLPLRQSVRRQKLIERVIKNSVENPDDFESVTGGAQQIIPERTEMQGLDLRFMPSMEGELPEYIIITNEELKPIFDELAEWKIKKGIPTLVVTTQQIADNYAGCDLAEKIRNYLKDANYYWGADLYILLGGDTDIVPERLVPYSNYFIPTDLYYATVEGNWNANGNNIFGEGTPYNNIDEVDYGYDHSLGRASVEDITEAQTFVDKVISYEKLDNPAFDLSDVNNVLLMTAFAYIDASGNPDGTWGMEGYTEIYNNNLPPQVNGWRMFDDHENNPYTLDEDTNREYFLNALSNGGPPFSHGKFHIVSHLDHSGYYYMGTSFKMKGEGIIRPDMDNLENVPPYQIVITQGCSPNKFDLNCICEHYINNPESGGVAIIGNSGPGGWTDWDQTQRFCKQIYGTESNGWTCMEYNLGVAFQEMTLSNEHTERKKLTLLGDPEMPIWTIDTLIEFDIVVNPSTITNGENEITITINNLEANVTATVCLQKEDEAYGYQSIPNLYSEDSAIFIFTPDTPGEVDLTVTAHNYLPYEDTIPVNLTGGSHLYITGKIFDDDNVDPSYGNGDGQVDAGETIELSITLTNSGSIAAPDVSAELSCESEFITITQNQSDFGNINAGESVVSQANYVFEVDPDTPDEEYICDTLFIYEGTALLHTDYLYFQVGAPELNKVRNIYTDSDGDGIIEADETITLKFDLFNEGYAEATGVIATLSSNSPTIITITQNEVSYGEIASFSFSDENIDPFVFDISEDYEGETFNLEITNEYGRTWQFNNFTLNKPISVDYESIDFAGYLNEIDLWWEPVPDYINPQHPNENYYIRGYNIYRSFTFESSYEKLNTFIVEGTSYYMDTYLEPMTSYFYKIGAVTESGNESYLTEPFEAWTTLPYHASWPVSSDVGTHIHGSVNVYDIDLDGQQEIFTVIHQGGGYILGFQSNGEELFDIDNDPETVSGFMDFDAGIISTPALGDIDNDGIIEVVVTSRNGGDDQHKVFVYKTIDDNGDGKPDLLWEAQIGQSAWRGPVMSDINNDGTLEITAVGTGGALKVYDNQGNLLWSKDIDSGGYGMPAVADLDGDGYKEIIMGFRSGLYVWRHDGSDFIIDTNPIFYIGKWIVAPPVVVDLDNDGDYEIMVVATEDEDLFAYVYAVHDDGSLVSGWDDDSHEFPLENDSNGWSPTEPPAIAVGNLDSDDDIEVVIGGYEYLNAWHHDGSLLNENFPIYIPGLNVWASAPLLADIDEDPYIEIIMASRDKNIHAYNYNGTRVMGWPLRTDDIITASPCISDIDNDGKNELIAGNYSGKTYVWDTEGDPNKIEWGCYRNNAQNTGVYVPLDQIVPVTIYEDTTFEDIHIPYPIIIAENVMLLVLDGVSFSYDVTVNENSILYIFGNENDKMEFSDNAAILVYGNLMVDGCTVTSRTESWDGISCYEGSEVWIQNEACIEEAETGISCEGGEVHFLNSEINLCERGMIIHYNSSLDFISSDILIPADIDARGIVIVNNLSESNINISGTEADSVYIQGESDSKLGRGILIYSFTDNEENSFISNYAEFKNLDVGIQYLSYCRTDHEIENCKFENCDNGIQLFGTGSIKKLNLCEFIDNDCGIDQNTVVATVTNCVFTDNVIGIEYNNTSQQGGLQQSIGGVTGSYFGGQTDYICGVRCSDSSPRIKNCIFLTYYGILSVNNPNVNASFDANNVFLCDDSHLMFAPDSPSFSSGILLHRGHNDFYDENDDFTFLSNYNGSEITINADGNWWEDFDVDINDEAAIAPPMIIAERMDPEPNVPFFINPGNRFESASQEESLGNNETALNSFKEILNDKLESEKQYWGICIDKVYNLSMILIEDINALLNYYEILYQSTPNYLTEAERTSLQKILKNYQNKCFIQIHEYQFAADIVVERINNPVSPIDSLFAVMQLETIYMLSYIDSTSRSSCVRTDYDGLAPQSLKEHNQKHKNHWDEIYNLLGIGENHEIEVTQNIPLIPTLFGNYPNPFNPTTIIPFFIPKESKVELTVYNIKGQKVKTLTKDYFEKGFHKLIWYGKDSSGKEVGSGVYFYKLKVNGKDKSVRKCLLLK